MYRHSFVKNMANSIIYIGIGIILTPFLIIAMGLTLQHWYVIYPSVGGALVVVGFGIKVFPKARRRFKKVDKVKKKQRKNTVMQDKIIGIETIYSDDGKTPLHLKVKYASGKTVNTLQFQYGDYTAGIYNNID